MALIGIEEGIAMWPSANTAARMYNLANVGLIFSLIFGVISTVLVVWMGNVKEGYSQAELTDTKGRLGKAEIEAGSAIERAAKADLKRIELQNRIVSIFGPRHLTSEQSERIASRLAGLKGAKIDVYVLALGNPYSRTESEDSKKFGVAIVGALRSAHMDAEGWLLESCNGGSVSNLVISVTGSGSDDQKIASRVLKAFPPEIGVYPVISPDSPSTVCTKFSDLDEARPNRRKHDAAISIAIGRKINPLLTREMLEPDDEQNKP
jgi:hypothetical protein